jgi:hypothetical protein
MLVLAVASFYICRLLSTMTSTVPVMRLKTLSIFLRVHFSPRNIRIRQHENLCAVLKRFDERNFHRELLAISCKVGLLQHGYLRRAIVLVRRLHKCTIFLISPTSIPMRLSLFVGIFCIFPIRISTPKPSNLRLISYISSSWYHRSNLQGSDESCGRNRFFFWILQLIEMFLLTSNPEIIFKFSSFFSSPSNNEEHATNQQQCKASVKSWEEN